MSGKIRRSKKYVAVLKKRNGQNFVKLYYTATSKRKALEAWRRAGGRIVKG